LVLLGGLLLVAFIPLYFAVATYTSLALRQIRAGEARALGRAVGGHVLEAMRHRTPEELSTLVIAELGAAELLALGVYDRQGRAVVERGRRDALFGMGPQIAAARESTQEISLGHARALRVVLPSADGGAVVVVGIDEEAAQTAPLLRLLGLYTGLVGLALLVLSYFALTRLIVRPVDQLTRAAERVAGGARRWIGPTTSVRELSELGRSLGTMTEKLIRDEEAVRRKVFEVEAATSRLKEAQHRLVGSERLASVGRLAAGLAHEIGNPISALMGMQDLLLEGGLSESEQRDFVERMRRETERIHRILRDLLQFARPGARSSSEPVEPGDVSAAITDTATLVAPQKALKEVEIQLDIEQDLPLVPLSREQLVQILLNLVLNAADAVGGGGQIGVRARTTGGQVELTVEDDGPGVPKAIRDRLFEPFATTKEVGRGTGLGLAVCRGLVEAAGGTIALDEQHTAGAKFVILLPAIAAP
jgi:two-component system, NtrC family, sensor kinase